MQKKKFKKNKKTTLNFKRCRFFVHFYSLIYDYIVGGELIEYVILYFILKYKGNWEVIYKALECKEYVNHKNITFLKENLKCNFTWILGKDYPKEIKESERAPLFLFYKGNFSIISNFKYNVGIIGNKKYSISTLKKTLKLVDDVVAMGLTPVTIAEPGLNFEIIHHCWAKGYKNIIILLMGMDEFLLQITNLTNFSNTLIITEHYYLEKSFSQYTVDHFFSSIISKVVLTEFNEYSNLNFLLEMLCQTSKQIYAFWTLKSYLLQVDVSTTEIITLIENVA